MRWRGRSLACSRDNVEIIEEVFAHDGKCDDVATSCAEENLDWDSFNADATRGAMKRLTRVSKVLSVTIPTLSLAHVCRNGFAFSYLTTIAIFVVIGSIGAEMTNKLVHAIPEKSKYYRLGYLAQLFVFAVTLAVPHYACWWASGGLMKHRKFLTASLPIFVASPLCYHMPSPFFVGVTCPLWLSSLVFFHYSVGFLNLVCICYAVFCCIGVAYLNHLSIHSRRQHFQTTRALEVESKLLTATQNALHGMLSSLWDASCTCNAQGTISSSTPHLEQLLGATKDLVGSSLCAFAANGVEMNRLQDFLRSTASVAEHRALSFQCALRPHGSTSARSPKNDTSKVYDVALYGIKLPPMSPQHRFPSLHQDRLFIGIKAGAPEATIAESSCHTASDDYAFTDMCKPLGTLSLSETVLSQSAKSWIGSLGKMDLRSVAVQTFTSCTSTRSVQTGSGNVSNSGGSTHQSSSCSYVSSADLSDFLPGSFLILMLTALGLLQASTDYMAYYGHKGIKIPRFFCLVV